MLKFVLLLVTLISFISLAACGGRIPSAKSAQGLTASYFKTYSHQYKDSLIGRNPIKKIEINTVREQSLNTAEIQAYLNLKDGDVIRVLLTAKRTPPLGWSIKSWEMVDAH